MGAVKFKEAGYSEPSEWAHYRDHVPDLADLNKEDRKRFKAIQESGQRKADVVAFLKSVGVTVAPFVPWGRHKRAAEKAETERADKS